VCSLASRTVYDRFQSSLQALGPFESSPVIAVAVSGGADSLALTFLLHQWLQTQGGRLVALHVDHGLRDSSRQEALCVQAWLQAKGIEIHIFSWYPATPLTGLQEKARNARYSLLKSFCKAHHILHLFLAHHQDDQRETFFYRLSKGSGADGLAGMSAIEEQEDIRLLRPLLYFSKQELKTVLEDHPFITDPSNTNPAFWRGQFRTTLQNLTEPPLKQLGEERILAEQVLSEVLGQYTFLSEKGYVTLNQDFKMHLSEDMQRRVLERLLTTVGGHGYPVRSSITSGLLARMQKERVMTAGGCLIIPREGSYMIMREWARIQDQHVLKTEEAFLWDNRFLITPKAPDKNITCKALGDRGWIQVKNHLATQPYPHHFYKTLPAFFDVLGEVIFLPFGDFKSPQRMVDSAHVLFCPRSRLLRSLWFSPKE
jgi:tRNA(Ile)-lysidine synthase